jgi:hypothetical protein
MRPMAIKNVPEQARLMGSGPDVWLVFEAKNGLLKPLIPSPRCAGTASVDLLE